MTTDSTLIRHEARPDSNHLPITILLVEDQKSLCFMIRDMLIARWSCDVVTTHTLDETRTELAKDSSRFFLAISDINLPDTYDCEILDLLIENNVPTIAVTGNLDPGNIQRFRQKGVIDFVLKYTINAYGYVTDLVGRIYSNSSKHALVAGDAENLNRRIGRRLERQLFNVEYVIPPNEIVDKIKQNPDIKLVVLDYNRPENSTDEIIAELRKNYDKKSLVIIVTSKKDSHDLAEISLKLGANDFIRIPFSDAEFGSRVNRSMDLHDAYNEIAKLAYLDDLTGLANRRAFFTRANDMFKDSSMFEQPFGLMMLDIDRFKAINDKYGHFAGDMVLKHLSNLLSKAFKGELLARLGGEEFVLLTSDSTTLKDKAEKLCSVVENAIVKVDGQTIQYTVSIGVSTKPSDNIDNFLQRVDELLYQGKDSGRNCVVSDQ
jgi:diguanylate cyclase (GGDEF)-like protein